MKYEGDIAIETEVAQKRTESVRIRFGGFSHKVSEEQKASVRYERKREL